MVGCTFDIGVLLSKVNINNFISPQWTIIIICLIISEHEPAGVQPELQFIVSNIEMQFCETLTVIGASGSVGAVAASLKSSCK